MSGWLSRVIDPLRIYLRYGIGGSMKPREKFRAAHPFGYLLTVLFKFRWSEIGQVALPASIANLYPRGVRIHSHWEPGEIGNDAVAHKRAYSDRTVIRSRD